MSWILQNADWLSGLIGAVGSGILAWPMLSEIRDRRHVDRMADLRRRLRELNGKKKVAAQSTAVPTLPALPIGHTADEEALREIREGLIDDFLGNYQQHRKVAFVGTFLLFVSFILLFAFGLSTDKMNEHTHPVPQHLTPQ
jgi:hypothetical protein